MSVSAINSGGNAFLSGTSGLFHQRRQDFKAMENAVKNGDLASAQTALAAWQQDSQNIQNARGTTASPSSQSNNPFQTDLSSLTQAIQSGDINAAQTSLATLEKDRQGGTGNAVGQTPSSFLSDLQAMLQAVQSGDLGSAQKDAASLQNDMQTLAAGHHHHGVNSGNANGLLNAFSSANQGSGASGDGDADDVINATGSGSGINSAAQAAYAALLKPQIASALNIQA